MAEAKAKLSLAARIRQIMLGYSILALIDWLYDYPLYFFLIYKFGWFYGGIIGTIGSAIYCVIAIHVYDWLGEDWLGVNVLEHIKQKYATWLEVINDRGPIVRYMSYVPASVFGGFLWLLKKNDICAFFILCVVSEPFKTTAFLRHGKFGGLGKRDYVVLGLAILVCNAYWILRTDVIIDAFRTVFMGS